MRRRVVLHVVRPAEGGMREHVLALLKGLDGMTFRPMLAGPLGQGWDERLREIEVETINLPVMNGIDPVAGARAILALASLLRNRMVDLVHLHGYKAAFIGRLSACLAGLPPVVVTVHGPLTRPTVRAHRLVHWGERSLARFTDRYIAVSEAARRELIEKAGINPEKVSVIYNGVDPGRFNPSIANGLEERLRLGVGEKEFLVGSLCRMVPGKGLNQLLQAAVEVVKHMPGVRFCLAGEGPARPALERLARFYGLERHVIFPGFHRNVPALLAAMDVLVHPSLEEGLPLAVMEAMAMARPVIAASTGGIPELLGEGRGCLVPPGNPDALARAVIFLLSSPEARRHMGLYGRRFVEKNLSLSTMVARTCELYGEVLELCFAKGLPST